MAEPSAAREAERQVAQALDPADGAGQDELGARGDPEGGSCTQAQLRRFIKSRPYVPMHELRRRFVLNGATDEVQPIPTREGTIWIGLPARESGFIGDLLRHGEIGVELCHDPCVSIVVGIYAMRPVSR